MAELFLWVHARLLPALTSASPGFITRAPLPPGEGRCTGRSAGALAFPMTCHPKRGPVFRSPHQLNRLHRAFVSLDSCIITSREPSRLFAPKTDARAHGTGGSRARPAGADPGVHQAHAGPGGDGGNSDRRRRPGHRLDGKVARGLSAGGRFATCGATTRPRMTGHRLGLQVVASQPCAAGPGCGRRQGDPRVRGAPFGQSGL